MKKKMIFAVMSVMMAAVVGMPLMAAGAQEASDDFVRPYEQLEKKTLTGEVTLDSDGRASLTMDGQEYELLYPYIASVDLEIKSGDVVTVEGVAVPGPRWQGDEDVKYLRVTGAVIDGKEYDLEADFAYGWYGKSGAAGPMGRQPMNGRPVTGPYGGYGAAGQRQGGPGMRRF
jgi:hypothetical protein